MVRKTAEFYWGGNSVYDGYCSNWPTEETTSKVKFYGSNAQNEWTKASGSSVKCPSSVSSGKILAGSKKGYVCYQNPAWRGVYNNTCIDPQATAERYKCEDIPWSVGTAKKCSPDEITQL